MHLTIANCGGTSLARHAQRAAVHLGCALRVIFRAGRGRRVSQHGPDRGRYPRHRSGHWASARLRLSLPLRHFGGRSQPGIVLGGQLHISERERNGMLPLPSVTQRATVHSDQPHLRVLWRSAARPIVAQPELGPERRPDPRLGQRGAPIGWLQVQLQLRRRRHGARILHCRHTPNSLLLPSSGGASRSAAIHGGAQRAAVRAQHWHLLL